MKSLLVLSFVCLVHAQITHLHYEVGDQSNFQLNSAVDSRGHLVNGQRTSGAISTLTSTLVTQCVQTDSDSYYFVMNMFNTDVNAGQVSSKGTKFRGPDDEDNDYMPSNLGDGLGENMYYQQARNGTISQVWYHQDDSLFFVNIKLGAINSLQTYMVPGGSSQQVLVSDVVGTHMSNFQGAEVDTLTVTQTFNALDVQAFPDPNLSPNNVQLTANIATTVAQYPNVADGGYIQGVQLSQLVDFVDITQGNQQAEKETRNVKDDTPVDANVSNLGQVQLAMDQFMASAPFEQFKNVFSVEELKFKNYTQDTFFGAAQKGLIFARAAIARRENITSDMDTVLARDDVTPAEIKFMNKLSRHFNAIPGDIEILETYAKNVPSMSEIVRKKFLFILTGVRGHSAIDIFINHCLLSTSDDVQLDAVLASHGVLEEQTVERLKHTLQTLAFGGRNVSDPVRKSANLAFGSVVGKISNNDARKKAATLLLQQLKTALNFSDISAIQLAINSIGNAGPAVPFSQIPWSILLTYPNVGVRVAAAGALRKFKGGAGFYQVVSTWMRKESNDAVLRTLRKSCPDLPNFHKLAIEESNFPFNRSWSQNFTLGGSKINSQFTGLLFAGTNFDCNQEYFNYEAEGLATATLNFFEWSKEALDAEAIYGKENGQVVGNEIYFRVWDDVIYDQRIPLVDCSLHTYPLFHAQKGVDVSYTIWIYVIPVTLSASATATLDISWAWQICDSQLSAMVELIPDATITVDASSETYLLIVKAGIDFSGSFNMDIKPQAYIDGSECTVGFDVLLQTSPGNGIDLSTWYQWHSCTLWIFDCHWGTQHTQTWYKWNEEVENKVLINEDWKIAGDK